MKCILGLFIFFCVPIQVLAQRNICERYLPSLLQVDEVGPCYDFNLGKDNSPVINTVLPENLVGIKMQKASLRVDLKNRNLSFANLDAAIVGSRSFENSIFDHASLRIIKAFNSRWVGVRALNADFRAARLYFSDFSRCTLDGADFRFADLSFVDFSDCSLRSVDFRGAILIGTRFRGAKFNNETQLPFIKEEKHMRGLVEVQ